MRWMRDWTGVILGAVLASLGTGSVALGEVRIGYLTLEKGFVERERVAPGLMGGAGKRTLRDVIATLDAVSERDDLEGLVVRLREPMLGASQIEEIGRAMERVRASGKRVHVFTENYGTGEVLLGCHANEIILQRGGMVSVPGIYMEEMYLAETLRWVGIEPDFVQIGDYKGASEPLGRSEPSPEWEENISGLLDGMYGELLGTIMKGRRMSRTEAETALGECFWASGERAMAFGMIDAEVDRLELDGYLEKGYGEEISLVSDLWVRGGPERPDFAQMGMFEAFGTLMRMLSEGGRRAVTRDTIAVLYIDGMIVDGESESGLLGGAGTVGSVTIRKALREIEENELVRGVVVRIDSPGGSATASEMIWRGLRRVSEAGKPVWVSVGGMAASGGYYIAVGGDKVFVNSQSIVGSIGVVGGHLALGGLYEKLRMNVVGRARGPRAAILGSKEVWSEKERALIRERMVEVYELFASRVKQGRRGIDLGRTAEGRLFVGSEAVGLRMADGVKGIDGVITEMAGKLELSEGSYDVLDYPAPKSFEELIEETFGASATVSGGAGVLAEAGRRALGEKGWREVSWGVEAVLGLRERPVMLVMPRVLVWRW